MRFWWLLFIVVFSQKTFSAVSSPADLFYETGHPDSIARADQLNAKAYAIFLASPAAARKLSESALILSKVNNYKKGIGESFLNIGLTYWAQSYYQVSLLYLDTAVHYFDKNNHLRLSDCYRNMGRNYADLKNYKAAFEYLKKAQYEADTSKYMQEEVITERSLIYARSHQFKKAVTAVHEALKLCRQIHNTGTEAILYGRLTSIYSEYDGNINYKLADGYADTAISMSFLNNNKRLRTSCFVSKAEILLNLGKPDEALKYAQKANLMADSLGIMDFITASYQALIDVYQRQGNTKQVLYYQDKYNSFLLWLNTIDKQNSAQLMRDYFYLHNRLQKIDSAQHNNQINRMLVRSQQRIIIVLVISLGLLIAGLYVVYRLYREKKKLAVTLTSQNSAIRQQSELIQAQSTHLNSLNNLKNKLLMVIGHDLRGPIGNLRNVTDLFEQRALTDDEIHQVMKNMNPVVRGAELTLTNLLQWANNQIQGSNVATTDVRLMLVVDEMRETFAYLLSQKDITLQNNVVPKVFLFVDENHLKVIFRNMISNAIKFTPNGGCITVDAGPDADKILISIRDTGTGIKPEDIDNLWASRPPLSKVGTMGEIGTGIGLQLCRELIELNQGEISVRSTPGEGTTFYIKLPGSIRL
ncbi:ATP-binding protein [Mucilaginibacter sp. AW1-3]